MADSGSTSPASSGLDTFAVLARLPARAVKICRCSGSSKLRHISYYTHLIAQQDSPSSLSAVLLPPLPLSLPPVLPIALLAPSSLLALARPCFSPLLLRPCSPASHSTGPSTLREVIMSSTYQSMAICTKGGCSDVDNMAYGCPNLNAVMVSNRVNHL